VSITLVKYYLTKSEFFSGLPVLGVGIV